MALKIPLLVDIMDIYNMRLSNIELDWWIVQAWSLILPENHIIKDLHSCRFYPSLLSIHDKPG